LSTPTEIRIDTELLGYRLEALVGRGGMGVVYRAHDPRLKRTVALKLVAPELAADPAFRERFLAETELAASLEHPNVVPVYDAGEVEGQLYLAMRYVAGNDLKTLLGREGPLEPKRALALCAQVAGALDAAHARGLVHRDVKPSNVLLDEAEHVYLADFGLTRRITESGGLGPSLGTPAYAAPEQIEGAEVDGRADVYSLACLLYECLAGEVPFRRDSELAVLWAQVNEPPPRLGAYPALDPVLAKALAKDPQERYASCLELVEAAREALGLRDVLLVRDRRPLLLTGAGAVLVVTAVLLGVLLTRGGGPSRPSTKPTLAISADAIQRIDPKTNKLVATIRPGTNVGALAVGEGALWATGDSDGSLLRIDPKTNAVTARGSAGAAAGGSSYPAAGEGAVWVAVPLTGGFTEIDPRTLKILSVPPVDNCGAIAVGDGAAWTASSNSVFRVTIDGLVSSASVPVGCPDRGSLAVGAGAVWIVAGVLASTAVLRVDPTTLKLTATVPLAFLPTTLAADAEGVWVLDPRDDAVVRIDPRTNRVVAKLKIGHSPGAVAAGAGSVWVANGGDGSVSRIDPRRGKVVATIKIGPNPSALAAGEGGVWVIVHPK
jgi:DNA-binding beta-propeller fold protein YncE